MKHPRTKNTKILIYNGLISKHTVFVAHQWETESKDLINSRHSMADMSMAKWATGLYIWISKTKQNKSAESWQAKQQTLQCL
jgi:hypothetical protein